MLIPTYLCIYVQLISFFFICCLLNSEELVAVRGVGQHNAQCICETRPFTNVGDMKSKMGEHFTERQFRVLMKAAAGHLFHEQFPLE